MRIKKMLSQHRRDFTAIFECEHCGHEERINGYDDSFYHQKVVPKMECSNCGKTAAADYEPRASKYPDSMTV